eukprot:Gb_16553 [translate_table: standard]
MASIVLQVPPLRSVTNANPRGRGVDNDAYARVLLLSSYLPPSSKKLLVYGRQKKNNKKRCPLPRIYAQTGNAVTQLTQSEPSENVIKERLQDLADSLVLPSDYLAQLPNDLRLDLNDAAFDLASGLVKQECGEQFGEILMKLSQAWEKADTQATIEVASVLPSLEGSLSDDIKRALGKRFKSAGRHFASTGEYGQGELQKIAKAMVAAGEALAAGPSSTGTEKPIAQARSLKFGTLQVELTSKQAYIGSVIALAFGILQWQLAASVQSIPEDSLQYANGNALVLSQSLRGALLVLCYSCTLLSAITMVGLFLLGREASSEGK